MDYEQTLSATRRWLSSEAIDSPSSEALASALAAERRRQRRDVVLVAALALLVCATWAASVLAHPISSALCPWVGPLDVVRYGAVHVVGFAITAALIRTERAWTQMLARALWWSSLLAASVGLWSEFGTLPVLMPALAMASAIAILVRGDRGLDDQTLDADFPLVAHRRAVLLMTILAMADTETLLAAALNHEESSALGYAAVDVCCALAMIASVWGLYRLRAWGLVGVLATNLAVAGLGLTNTLIYDPGFAYALVVTAVLQLGLGLPLLRAVLVRESVGARPEWTPRWRWSWVVVAALLVADAVAVARGSDPQRLARECSDP